MARLRHVDSGQTIATTDDIDGLYCVKEGFVKRFNIKNDGSLSVQGVYGPGDCFGISAVSALLMRSHVYKGMETYYYEAISDAVIYDVNISILREMLSKHQELYKDLFVIQSWHGLSDIWRMENQALQNANKRVAHIICFYMERYGILTTKGWRFKVPFIQQDLADILDLSRETVSIAINELKKEKLIKGSRKIIVSNLAALKEYSYQ